MVFNWCMAKPTPSQRFKIQPFTNRSGSPSYRVTGTKRNGERVRENYTDAEEARLRHIVLETEFLKRESPVALCSTRLTEAQIATAETAFARVDDDGDLLRAVDYWLKHGKQ